MYMHIAGSMYILYRIHLYSMLFRHKLTVSQVCICTSMHLYVPDMCAQLYWQIHGYDHKNTCKQKIRDIVRPFVHAHAGSMYILYRIL